jgi:hypothetical protein
MSSSQCTISMHHAGRSTACAGDTGCGPASTAWIQAGTVQTAVGLSQLCHHPVVPVTHNRADWHLCLQCVGHDGTLQGLHTHPLNAIRLQSRRAHVTPRVWALEELYKPSSSALQVLWVCWPAVSCCSCFPGRACLCTHRMTHAYAHAAISSRPVCSLSVWRSHNCNMG